MTADEILDTIIRYPSQKGIAVDDTVLRPMQLLGLFGTTFSSVLLKFISNGYIVSGSNFLTGVYDKIDYAAGNNKFNYFNIYPAVMNMYDYIGSEGGCNRFVEYSTKGTYASTMKSQIPKRTGYLTENERYLKIDNTQVIKIEISYIPINPFLDPTFNPEYDQYPVDEGLIIRICDEMYASYQSKLKNVMDTSSPTA